MCGAVIAALCICLAVRLSCVAFFLLRKPDKQAIPRSAVQRSSPDSRFSCLPVLYYIAGFYCFFNKSYLITFIFILFFLRLVF